MFYQVPLIVLKRHLQFVLKSITFILGLRAVLLMSLIIFNISRAVPVRVCSLTLTENLFDHVRSITI